MVKKRLSGFGALLKVNYLYMFPSSCLHNRILPTIIAVFLLYSSPAVTAENEKRSDKACLKVLPAKDTYLDTTHGYLSTWFCEPANWFDNFFADERLYEEGYATTKLRWRNDLKFSESASPDFVTTVNASLRLPNISKRLNLVFDSDEQADLNDIIPGSLDNAQGTLSFLYDFLDTQKANLSLRLRLSPSITLRYRYTHPVSETLVTRFTQNIFREDGFFGENTRFDIDKAIDKKNALRWINQVEIIEDKDGLEWLSALVLFHQIDGISALSYESSITGETRPFDLVTDYRFGIRYRRNFFRDWLFYELVPEVTWPKESMTDKRRSVIAFTVRLEVYFESTN